MKLVAIFLILLLTNCTNDIKKTNIEKESDKNIIQEALTNKNDPLINLNNDSLKHYYGERFDSLRAIINKNDPIGLIANGAPDDEYDAEVGTIIVQLNKEMTEQQIQELLYREFIRWFDDESTAGPKEAYKKLSQDIYAWTQKATIR